MAIGQCVVDADFIINDNGCQLKLSINVNSRGVIGGYAERCSSFDSRLIVFCSSELGFILLSASLTPACRLSPPISFSKDQAGAKFDDPKRKAYMLNLTQACNSMTHAERK